MRIKNFWMIRRQIWGRGLKNCKISFNQSVKWFLKDKNWSVKRVFWDKRGKVRWRLKKNRKLLNPKSKVVLYPCASLNLSPMQRFNKQLIGLRLNSKKMCLEIKSSATIWANNRQSLPRAVQLVVAQQQWCTRITRLLAKLQHSTPLNATLREPPA